MAHVKVFQFFYDSQCTTKYKRTYMENTREHRHSEPNPVR